MGRLLFTNLSMLAGLAALAVPILIHLLIRRKTRRFRFSTLQFFQKQEEQSSQRRKLRNLLLLAVRLLLLALLVLAFARPYLPGGMGSDPRRPPRLAVLVVDRTASMQATDGGASRWARAKEAMRKTLEELGPDDRAALVSCSSHAEVLSGAAPVEVVSRLLKDLQPACGTSPLGDGLQLAGKIVSSAGADFVPIIHVISDLQCNGCQTMSACPLPREVEVKAATVGDVFAPNLAIAALQLESRDSDPPHVVIAKYSDDDTKSVNLKLVVDEKEVVVRPVAMATGAVTRVDLTLPKLPPGWHSGTARIEATDALAIDNTRYEAFFVPQPIRTLVVETRRGKRIFEEESFFVVSALDPMYGTTNAGFSRFGVEKVPIEEAVRKLSVRSDPPPYDVVVLPGLKEIPSGLARELGTFLQAGGGLLLFLGDDISASRYNTEFQEFLPVQLGHVERNTADAPDQRWHLEECDFSSPIFAVFRRPNSGNLALPEFTRRFTAVTNEAAVVPARFAESLPLVASRTVGRGRVVLVNTSADTAWTDWPKHKTFVPWLHSVCYHLAARAGAEPTRTALRLVAADDVDIPLGPSAKQKTFQVSRPGTNTLTVTADENGRLRNADFSRPGIYSVRDQAGQEVRRVAVNLPLEESDLTALTAAEFQRQLVRLEKPQETAAGSFWGIRNQRNEFWRLLLLAVLGLLFAEVFLANRTYA
jgi:hypothetical protein